MPISRNASPRGWSADGSASAQQSRNNTHVDLIQQSHERCTALGLTRIERPDYSPLMRSDLNVARERNQRLFAHAAPVMEMLFEHVWTRRPLHVWTRRPLQALRGDGKWSARMYPARLKGTAFTCPQPR